MKRILTIARALVAHLLSGDFGGKCLHARYERAQCYCGGSHIAIYPALHDWWRAGSYDAGATQKKTAL
jgi:hypothetical protein